MRARDPRGDRLVLAAWIAGAFVLSAVTDWRLLAGGLALALLLLAPGHGGVLRRTVTLVLPAAAGVPLASFLLLRALGERPEVAPYGALALRSLLVGYLGLSALARADLFRALAPWPLATRLLVVTLAQIHALRRIRTEALLGFQSRTPRRPRLVDVAGNAGGITATLFTLAERNARELSDAIRSRGF